MVKRRGKRQRTRRRRKTNRRSRPTKAFTRKVRKVIEKSAEHKFIDLYVPPQNFNNGSGVINLLPSITTTGSGQGQRIGQQIKIRSLRIHVQTQVVTGYAPSLQRMIIGIWKDWAHTTPLASKLVQDVADPWKTFYLRENLQQKLWKPLYDKRYDQVFTYPETSRYKLHTFNLYGKRLPVKTINYTLSTGAEDNMYFLYLWDTSVGAAPFNQVSVRVRMTYTDV